MEEVGANIPPIKVYPDKFKDQIVLITGAAQGIGEKTAKSFAAQGATTVLVDLNQEKLQLVAAKIEAMGGRFSIQVCNVVLEEEVAHMVQDVMAKFDRIDILIHLAGIYPFIPILNHPTADYLSVLSVSMDGCFFLTRAVLPHMNKAGYGRIINTASASVQHPEPGMAAYVTAKAAVIGFTRVTAVEAGPGITANVVAPGLIRTDKTWDASATPSGSHPLFDKVVEMQVVKRHGLPEDVAQMIGFIASPEAQFITGQVFDVSGGFTFQ
jgi:NAD(P)-dependent dehydrogenase (short-subunit alcohol dehydrogenase family)